MGKSVKSGKGNPNKSKGIRRKKGIDVYSYEEDDDIKGKKKIIDLDSDSDNEYGGVKGDDDDSIDDEGSDIGWNSDDEMAYGKILRKRHTNDVSDQSDDQGLESDNDDMENGEILLSDMFGSNTTSTHGDLQNASSNDDESDGDASDGSGHDRLLSAIEKFSKSNNSTFENKSKVNRALQGATDSAYSSIPENNSSSISLDALLGALSNTKNVKAVKQQLSELQKSSAPPKHVHKTVSDKIERNLVYDNNSKDISKWQQVVSENKHSTSLDLANDTRQLPAYRNLVKEYQPVTDMEREVQMVLLTQSSENKLNEEEIDDLGARDLSLEEIKQRQADLAKVRALMFYEQMKRHRINKIKSKAYHRILKRKKERSNKGGVDDSVMSNSDDDGEGEEAEEDQATKRVKERMNLKHQNTGRWAKMALQYGKTDKSLR
jgi:U3 small nucleolar RNA-associated protein 14